MNTMAVTLLPLSPLVSATPTFITPTNQNDPKTTTKHPSPNGSFQNCKSIKELKQVQSHFTKKGLTHSPSTVSKLIVACAQMGTLESLDYAQKAFKLYREDEGSIGSLFMYNSLIRGYSSAGFGDAAILLYIEMVIAGIVPDKFTFPFVLSACAKIVGFCEGIQVHGVVVKMGLEEDVFIGNSLIHLYAECGKMEYTRKVFDGMLERNVVSWTSLICGYARRDCPEDAVSLFYEMVETGITPNSVTMVCVISACAKLKDLELGEKVSAYVGEEGVKCNTFMVNALVDMYMKCGAIGSAKRLFDECVDRNLVLCNTIMSNYVRQGLVRDALAVFGEMLQQGPRPDRVTMLSAISACAQLGDLLFGKQCHGYVLRNGLESWDNISNAMIDMYMKCAKQEMAHRVFNFAQVRLQLKEKGIHKVPGSSSMQVNGIIHEFTSGDESHPEKAHIAMMLQEINCRLKDAGHVPDLTNVMLDVDEHEKEYLLSQHSEKLAIAFGLISTGQGTPIRVVKNLRICADCHSFSKLASRIYEREIIVRDNSRFHFFRQGNCSCCDYW
ncbi:pentatricopeptide repeat-containing protein [Quercus suber]|uniref:Pentatricopeptide repeat-containing protein n=1 Tax=Quercus suber TaxID=58331 RepID=A0AAW0IZ55_QUESU